MTKSDLRLPYPPIPERLQQIDELTFEDHYHVSPDDECFYLWERVSGARYNEYPTNDLISNIQIPTTCRAQNRWYWKWQAIRYAAKALSGLIPGPWRMSTFIPIPPSLTKDHPEHDSRILDLLNAVWPKLPDIRELVLSNQDTIAKQKNVSPRERADNYRINEDCACPEPDNIVIFDDVLAGGSHFKAMKMVLRERFPDVGIAGLFLARAIHPNATLIADLDDVL